MGAGLGLAIASTAISAGTAMFSARNQQAAYEQQAYNARLQADAKAANYEQQAAREMENAARYRATLRASFASMGGDPFGGSALRLQEVASMESGRAQMALQQNAALARSSGNLNAGLYENAASNSSLGGFLNAAGAITGMLGNIDLSKIGGGGTPSSGLSAAAGGEVADTGNMMFDGGPQPFKNKTMLGG